MKNKVERLIHEQTVVTDDSEWRMAVKWKGLRGVSQVSELRQLAAFCRSSARHRRTTKLPSESQCEQYPHPAEKVCACVIVVISLCGLLRTHLTVCVCVCVCVCMSKALLLPCVVGDDASLAGTSWCRAQRGPNWTACFGCLITNRPRWVCDSDPPSSSSSSSSSSFTHSLLWPTHSNEFWDQCHARRSLQC